MKSIVLLEKCLLSEDVTGVLAFVNSFDPAAGNEKMAAFCRYFELPTVAVSGILYTHLSRASLKLGYSDESGLRKTLDRYEIQAPKIGWFGQIVRTSIRAAFELSEKDSQATLLSWGGVLVAGMSGRGKAAKAIRLYLYAMEVAGSDALSTVAEIKRADAVRKEEEFLLRAIKQYEATSNASLKGMVREMIERRTGKEILLPKDAQMELPVSAED